MGSEKPTMNAISATFQPAANVPCHGHRTRTIHVVCLCRTSMLPSRFGAYYPRLVGAKVCACDMCARTSNPFKCHAAAGVAAVGADVLPRVRLFKSGVHRFI